MNRSCQLFSCPPSLMTGSVRKRPIASLIATMILSASSIPASHSATINVNSTADDGADTLCTLREAVVSINEQSLNDPDTMLATGCAIQTGTFGDDDRIVFSTPDNSMITLNGSELLFERSMIVDGSSINSITV